jgi:large subunit ribosomal protein L24
MLVRKDDNVLVIKGRDRGKQGLVQRVETKDRKVVVEGVNVSTKHSKPSSSGARQGGIIQKEMPVPISNVMLVCTSCSQPARISVNSMSDGTKVRVCKRCEEVIE